MGSIGWAQQFNDFQSTCNVLPMPLRIAWPDEAGNGKWCWHVHPEKTLMDVEAGHRIVHKRKTFQVKRVKPYRTSECKHEQDYPWIQSGQPYLAGGLSGMT